MLGELVSIVTYIRIKECKENSNFSYSREHVHMHTPELHNTMKPLAGVLICLSVAGQLAPGSLMLKYTSRLTIVKEDV